MQVLSNGNGYGEQADGSVIDKNGLIITAEERVEIDRSVYALPIYQETIRGDIMYHLKNGDDLIIDGSTGSGKSTGVPIFAREATGLKVIQTVPRVLAAMSLAERISKILLAQTGDPKYTLGYDEVGYRTGTGVSAQRLAALSTHTDGLEMMRMLYSSIYSGVLIVDEVQNKSIATEIILFIAKHNLDIQLIIMSATLDPETYKKYQESRGRNMPIIEIPGRTFPIEKYYNGAAGAVDKTISLAKEGKHTLHLVSGKSRIDEVILELQKELGHGYEIMPLHAELSKEDQFKAVILPEDPNIIRVIVATNVAEESITIPYLNAVVDEGLHKVGRVNHEGNPELRIEPITLANTNQRAGRVGRTQPGEYHRHNDTPIEDLHDYPEAAIENSRLEREILLFAKSGKDLYSIVSRGRKNGKEAFLHEVDLNLLQIGYDRLTSMGALDDFGNISPLGEDILSIGLEPAHARMVIEGITRGCAEELVVIASILSVNGFLSKDGTWKEIKNGNNKKTDFLTYLDLYDLATKKRLSQDIIERLVFLGLERDEMIDFQNSDGMKHLFEMVNLEPLGIKNHRVAQILNKTTLIKKSLKSRGVSIDEHKKLSGKQIKMRDAESGQKGTIDNILTSVTAGYPFYIYKYNPETKRFEHDERGGKKTSDDFRQASISSVTPTPNKLYVGEPFIIGPNELSMQGDVEHFFDGLEPVKQDLCILSHVSEIDESHIKGAIQTQNHYSSVFSQKISNNTKKGPTYTNIGDVESTYQALVEEFAQGNFSHKKFLQYALPLFLMSNNSKFIKFLDGKSVDILMGLEQRIRKFLIHREDSYIHRVSDSIEDTENSFKDDSYIYDEWREWEQSDKNIRKKVQRRGRKLNRTEADLIEKKAALNRAKQAFAEIEGLFVGGNFDRNFDEKGNRLLSRYIDSMILEGVTYNTLLKIHTDEFLGKNVHERQTEIKKTSEAGNQKSTLRASKTRISQINSEMGDILLLKQYSDFPSEANYNQIHFDICNQILATDANQKLFNNSQRSRYHKGISAIHHAYNDTTGKTSIERALKRGGNAFSTIIKILEEEKGRLLADIKEKEEVIESKKQGTLATRKELHFFFERIYEEEYFNTVIQGKISKILIDILASGDLAGTIEKWIYSDFDMRKLKKLARAKDIHNFVKKEREYKQLLEKAKKKISAIHKLNHPEANVFTNAASEIGDTRKSLTDLKSQILSI